MTGSFLDEPRCPPSAGALRRRPGRQRPVPSAISTDASEPPMTAALPAVAHDRHSPILDPPPARADSALAAKTD